MFYFEKNLVSSRQLKTLFKYALGTANVIKILGYINNILPLTIKIYLFIWL